MVRVDIQKTDDKIVALTAVMPIKSRDDKVPSMSFPPEVSLATLAPGFRRQPGR